MSDETTSFLPKISLAMIVKDCAKDLARCLNSIAEHVDEIVVVDTGSEDETVAVAGSYGAKLHSFTWCDDFAKARNFSFDHCSHDLVIWLDSDDIVIGGKQLIEDVKMAAHAGFNQIKVRYDYDFDERMKCITRQMRERVVDRGVHHWASPIHECLIADFYLQAAQVKATNYIEHQRFKGLKRDDPERRRHTDRNLKIMRQLDKEGKLETRTYYYYGNTLLGIGEYDEAIEKYMTYCKRGGVPLEEYSALKQASACHIGRGRLPEAKTLVGHAIMAFPKLPSAYVQMAACYWNEGRWTQTIDWCEEAISHRVNMHDEYMFNPTEIDGAPHMMMAVAHGKMGNMDRCLESCALAEVSLGTNAVIDEIRTQALGMKARMILIDGFKALEKQLVDEKKPENVKRMAELMPDAIKTNACVRRHLTKLRPQDKPTVAIVCPGQWEFWGPSSIASGIGGSETAVIQMSRELVKQGFHVEVYAYTKEEGEHDGVQWYPTYAYNQEEVDALIWWRAPNGPIMHGMNAKVSWTWQHDIPTPMQWIKDWDLMLDRVIVLSEYQRKLYSFVPDSLVTVSSNGLDPSLFVDGEVQPGKIIYSSCPSRGLVHLLHMWGYIRDRVPTAELHCFYGWNNVALARVKSDKAFEALYLEIERLKELPGIVWHGRTGKPELYQHMATAQIWAYPTMFPEISCITGMEAQAMGAMPLVNDFAAVSETVQFGAKEKFDFAKKTDEKRYADLVIKHLQHPEFFTRREEMKKWGRAIFPWSTVASQWAKLLREDLAKVKDSADRRVIPAGMVPRRRQVASTS